MENYSSSLDESLLNAYQHTTYSVSSLEINIRIGEKCRLLDQLLQKLERETWCFITAWNPYSKLLPKKENQERNSELVADIKKLDMIYYNGLGIGDDPSWEPEESFLVIGLNREEASALAKKYEQNAIVFGKRKGDAKLIFFK